MMKKIASFLQKDEITVIKGVRRCGKSTLLLKKKEFEDTKRIHVPMHSVLRIDELEKTASFRPRVISIDAGSGPSAQPAPVLFSPPK